VPSLRCLHFEPALSRWVSCFQHSVSPHIRGIYAARKLQTPEGKMFGQNIRLYNEHIRTLHFLTVFYHNHSTLSIDIKMNIYYIPSLLFLYLKLNTNPVIALHLLHQVPLLTNSLHLLFSGMQSCREDLIYQ